MLSIDKPNFLKTLKAALPCANVRDGTITQDKRAELIERIIRQPKRKHIIALGSGALHNGDMK